MLLFDQVEQQHLSLLASGEGDWPLAADAGAIAGREHAVAQRQLSGDDMQPGASPERQVMHDRAKAMIDLLKGGAK